MNGTEAETLACDALRRLVEPYGCTACGAAQAAAGAWKRGEMRVVELSQGRGRTPAEGGRTDLPSSSQHAEPTCTDARCAAYTLVLAHDERGAPVATDAQGRWDDATLVSLTDEGDLALCAWARPPLGSPIVGLGVDLASAKDFAGEMGARFNPHIFTEREHAIAPTLAAGDEALGYACAFSAKEAAFKACAAPLRAWYRTQSHELIFDITSFELGDAWHELGTARKGHAARAIAALGIARIELARATFDGIALTLAIALRAER